MSLEEFLAALPQASRKHLEPDSPLPMRMMAAKGMAPLPPVEMVIVVAGLTHDVDDKLASTARASLAQLPEKILGPALDADLPPVVLDTIGSALEDRPALQEKLVLNRKTPDSTLAEMAASAPAVVVEIIAGNQERCLRSEAIVRAIAKNSNILRSSLDRLFDFLVRSGVIYEEMPEFVDAIGRLSPSEMQEAANQIAIPAQIAPWLDVNEGHEEPVSAQEIESPSDPAVADKRRSMRQQIAGLNVAQKVALAMRGNREARTLLIRDTNRVVAAAAIRNPRVTEQEVIAAAQSRSVGDEVVRVIASTKELSRPYGVKVALVNNPKTPLPTAMRFLTLLRQNDIKAVAKSKNVPTAIANQAKRVLNAKKGGTRH